MRENGTTLSLKGTAIYGIHDVSVAEGCEHGVPSLSAFLFDCLWTALASKRAQFFRDVPSGPFYGFNRGGATILVGVIQNWRRQGMMGSAKAHHEGIRAFPETDQANDLKAITVPMLVLHGEDDQVVPVAASPLKAIELLRDGMLKTFAGFSNDMLTVNADLLEFVTT